MISRRFSGNVVNEVYGLLKETLKLIGDTESKVTDFEVFEGFAYPYGSLTSLFDETRKGSCYRIRELFPETCEFKSRAKPLNHVIELCEEDPKVHKYLFNLCVEEGNVSWESTICIVGPEKYTKLLLNFTESIRLILEEVKLQKQYEAASYNNS